MEVVGLFLFLIFGGLIGGIVFFVVKRNNIRKAAQAAVWQKIASDGGGVFKPAQGLFGGHTITFDRPYGRVILETRLLSAMDERASPYHTGAGGTYTHARVIFPKPTGPSFTVDVGGDPVHELVKGGVDGLPASRRIICNQDEMIIVLHGAVADEKVLTSALGIVERAGQAHAAAA
jgi:hypothetical protein